MTLACDVHVTSTENNRHNDKKEILTNNQNKKKKFNETFIKTTIFIHEDMYSARIVSF